MEGGGGKVGGRVNGGWMGGWKVEGWNGGRMNGVNRWNGGMTKGWREADGWVEVK